MVLMVLRPHHRLFSLLKGLESTQAPLWKKRTLHFRILSTVYMSRHDPHGNESLGVCQYVHLYDLLDQYVGAADISHADVLRSLNVQSDTTTEFIDPQSNRILMNIAVLSGLYLPSSKTRHNIWIGGGGFKILNNTCPWASSILHSHAADATYTSKQQIDKFMWDLRASGTKRSPGFYSRGLISLEWEDILFQ